MTTTQSIQPILNEIKARADAADIPKLVLAIESLLKYVDSRTCDMGCARFRMYRQGPCNCSKQSIRSTIAQILSETK